VINTDIRLVKILPVLGVTRSLIFSNFIKN